MICAQLTRSECRNQRKVTEFSIEVEKYGVFSSSEATISKFAGDEQHTFKCFTL